MNRALTTKPKHPKPRAYRKMVIGRNGSPEEILYQPHHDRSKYSPADIRRLGKERGVGTAAQAAKRRERAGP